MLELPNKLTLARIALIPVLVALFYVPLMGGRLLCAGVFLLAAITDWLDGYLARRNNQITSFGAFLDPVADKLIVVIALVLIVQVQASAFMTIPAAIIIAREILVSALREWMAELGERAQVAVSWMGKVKTCLQMLSVLLLLIYRPGDPLWLEMLGFLSLYLAAGMTLWSMVLYLQATKPFLLPAKTEEKAPPA